MKSTWNSQHGRLQSGRLKPDVLSVGSHNRARRFPHADVRVGSRLCHVRSGGDATCFAVPNGLSPCPSDAVDYLSIPSRSRNSGSRTRGASAEMLEWPRNTGSGYVYVLIERIPHAHWVVTQIGGLAVRRRASKSRHGFGCSSCIRRPGKLTPGIRVFRLRSP